MDVFLSVLRALEAISVVVLAVIGIFKWPEKIRTRLVLVIFVGITYVVASVLVDQIKGSELEKQKGIIKSFDLVISEPLDGSQVPFRPIVRGTVSDPDAELWVVVHPLEESAYWVQPRVTLKGDGTWQVKIYLGSAGSHDVGKQFEIMAVAYPKEELNEGKILETWPRAQWRSQVIEVTRQ